MPPDVSQLWAFLPLGYVLTIALETPVLLLGLSARHSLSRRLLAGVWLTACTYPIVVIVLPLTVWPQFGELAYVACAEIFASIAEAWLFWQAFDRGQVRQPVGQRGDTWQDIAAIVLANLVSFVVGGWLVEVWW